jgi:hypothetical protein
MTRNMLGAAVAAFILGFPLNAVAEIGDWTGTSTPTVIIPQTVPAPQTPPYPTPPPGSEGVGLPSPHAPRGAANRTAAPRVVTPPAIRN